MYYSVLSNVLTFHASILYPSVLFLINVESQVLSNFDCNLTAMTLVSNPSSRNQHFEMTFESPVVAGLACSPTQASNNRLCLG